MNRQLLHLLSLLFLTVLAAITRQYWLGSPFEWSAVGLLIMVAGIPHGSLDHLLARHRTQQFRLPLYLAVYLLTAGLYLGVWLLAPGIAFLLFIGFTAWHFGETDFNCFTNGKTTPLLVFLYGLSLTCWLLTQDAALLQELTALITRNSALAAIFVKRLLLIPSFAWLLLCGSILLLKPGRLTPRPAENIIFLLFLYLLSHTSLLLGFVLYFTGWHSLQALQHIQQAVFRQAGLLTLIRKAAPATAGALLLLLMLGWLSDGAWLKAHALPGLFVLLSILTLPHMTEMHRLYRKPEAG
jgi:Brp/Blh family beta-carotene 15,15'-monooxygenase